MGNNLFLIPKTDSVPSRRHWAQIEAQSEFDFFFNDDHVDLDRIVSINADGSNVFAILDELFEGTDVNYAVRGKKIILSTAIPSPQATQQSVEVKGRVVDASGEAIIGASVMEAGTANGVITDLDGNFVIRLSSADASISISYVGYVSQTVKATPDKPLHVVLGKATRL